MDGIGIVSCLFLLAGFILVGVEIWLPGFGLPGISGIVCLALGVICGAGSLEEGMTLLILVLVGVGLLLTGLMVLLTRRRNRGGPFVLEERLQSEDTLSAQDLSYLLGREGEAVTDLRPAGKVRIDGVLLDVQAQGVYLPRGSRVVIKSIQGNNLQVVEKEN